MNYVKSYTVLKWNISVLQSILLVSMMEMKNGRFLIH